jgi:glycosyltransferase involved in cell wall biosynthesis
MNPIIVTINNLRIGGAERLAVDQVNELHRRGIPVILLTFSIEDPARTFMSSCDLPESDRVLIPIDSIYDLSGFFALVRFLRHHRPRIFITHLWFANTIGCMAGRLVGIRKIFIFEHNVYDRVKTVRQFFADRLLQIFPSNIIAVSEAVRDSLVAHGISAKRVSVIINGINLKRFSDAQAADIRKEKSLDGEFLFFYAGRLIEQKGVDILLDAFAGVGGGILLIAGDGMKREALKMQARDLGIGQRVFFLGLRDDIPALMKACDCFVLPSRWEGLGLVIPEAFASGLPVITTDFPASRGMVEDGQNGLVVERENPAALMEAMEHIRTDTQLRRLLVSAATDRVATFSIQCHTDILLAV